jgi:uncharacterized protein (DUF1684 family)
VTRRRKVSLLNQTALGQESFAQGRSLSESFEVINHLGARALKLMQVQASQTDAFPGYPRSAEWRIEASMF